VLVTDVDDETSDDAGVHALLQQQSLALLEHRACTHTQNGEDG